MADVQHLDLSREINTDLVPYLVNLLARAQRGEIVQATFACVSADGSIVASYAGTPGEPDLVKMLGALSYTQAVLNSALARL